MSLYPLTANSLSHLFVFQGAIRYFHSLFCLSSLFKAPIYVPDAMPYQVASWGSVLDALWRGHSRMSSVIPCGLDT
jgi:hypothetical protein